MSGDEVRLVRRVLGLSQRGLARVLGVGLVTAARWEVGGEGGHTPAGLALEVLRALHGVALRVEADPAWRRSVSSRVSLGVGALVSDLLLAEVASVAAGS